MENAPFDIKFLGSLRIVHKNFFLYDNENMVVETYVSESNRNISSCGMISLLGKQASLEKKLYLIRPRQKLKFNVKKDFYKNKIEFELGRVRTKKSFNTLLDNNLNLGILCTKKNKTISDNAIQNSRFNSHPRIAGFVQVLASQPHRNNNQLE